MYYVLARLRFAAAALILVAAGILAAAAPPAVTPAQAATCSAPCLDFASGLAGGRRLVEANPTAPTPSVAASTVNAFGWHVSFPRSGDQAHGHFQLVSAVSGNCLTMPEVDDRLFTSACTSDADQYWYFVKGSMTDSASGASYYQMKSAANGTCVVAESTATADGAAARTAACGTGPGQQWLVNSVLAHPGTLGSIIAGTAIADSFATSALPRGSCAAVCLAFASGLSGARMLDEGNYGTSSLALTFRSPGLPGWNVSFPTVLDRYHGRFQLVAPDNQRCLGVSGSYTQVVATPCTTGNNQQYWTFAKSSRTEPVTGASYYQLVSAADGRCAVVANSADVDFGQVVVAPCADAPNQQWLVEDANSASGTGSSQSILSGAAIAASYLTLKNGFHIDGVGSSYALTFTTHLAGSATLYAPSATAGLVIGTSATAFNVNFGSTSDMMHGYFQLVHNSGLCLTDPGDTSQLTLASCVNQDGTTADDRQQWYFTLQDGGFQLRSKYDSHCVDVSGANGSAGTAAISYPCWLAKAAANQVWTLGAGAGSPDLNPITIGGELARLHILGAADDARTANDTSTIQFCNHGAYVAHPQITSYREYTDDTTYTSYGVWKNWDRNHAGDPEDGTHGLPASDSGITAGSCASLRVPAGQGIVAQIKLDEDTSAGMKTLSYIDLAAPYTNIEFDYYGTICDPSYTVVQNDHQSQMATALVTHDQRGSCSNDDGLADAIAADSTNLMNLGNTNLLGQGPSLGWTQEVLYKLVG